MLATGARPAPLPISGAEHLIDSTDLLNLEELSPLWVDVPRAAGHKTAQ